MAGEIEAGHGKFVGIIGIIVICFATIDIIVGFVWVSYGGGDANGIWCGLLLLITGILGVVTWIKLKKITMVFFLVFCIIDIISTIVQAAIAAIAFLIWQLLKAAIKTHCTIKSGECDCGDKKVPVALKDCSWISSIEAVFLTLLIVNGLCLIVVFAGSIIGCMATCCARRPQQQPGVVVIQQPGAGVIVTPHPAGAVQVGYPSQPVYPGQAGYAAQPGYVAQPGYAGQTGFVPQPVEQGPPPVYGQQQQPPEQIAMKDAPQ